ncbi:glycosyltransferase family 117 protein [Desulfogranum japonicum]|uniref:glycosyltransferase family 117 protein n=1 Tax=Desulfogranum japonicum TaxID=231447 RepID=UPI0003FB308F|nr:DUF2723 domain-containing protein [Desulfogranum japonicum]
MPLIVGGMAFLIFFSTMAPTVSFWDCGEYITAAYTLGINHPPGNPLYVLLGRIFTILPVAMDQIAARVNMLSVCAGALTASVVYTIITTIVANLIGTPRRLWQQLTIITAGMTGALFAVLNYTFWFSAVEASAYAPSMLMLVTSFYLVLKWNQTPTEEGRDRFLICAIYTSFLGIGFHFFSVLALPPLFLYIIAADKTKRQDTCFWLSFYIFCSIAFATSTFIFISPLLLIICAVFAFTSRPLALPLNWACISMACVILLRGREYELMSLTPYIALLCMVIVETFFSRNRSSGKTQWRLLFFLSLAAFLGFSVFFTIPLRSHLHPPLDHGHTDIRLEQGRIDATAFRRYLDRSEYIPDSMLTRMLHRRGTLQSQFGFDDRIGYMGFQLTQLFHFGKTIAQDRSSQEKNTLLGGPLPRQFIAICIYLLPTMLMLYGIYFWIKKDAKATLLLVSLYLLSSFGMVLYLNFSDGTQTRSSQPEEYRVNPELAKPQEKDDITQSHAIISREVRTRDYYFTAAFVCMGIWIGLAIAGILYSLARSANARLQRAGLLCSYLFLAAPLIPLLHNYGENNRSDNWLTYDNAYNTLMSCDNDGILFTDGDDIFFFWFMQEVEGIRKDVSVVSTALLPRKWYLKHWLQKKPPLPMSIALQEVEAGLSPLRNMLAEKTEIELPHSKLAVQLPDKKEKHFFSIEEQLLLDIIDTNNFSRPVYFPINVHFEYFAGIWKYLEIEGMVYRLHDRPIKDTSRIHINMERTKYLFSSVYQYRNKDNTSIMFSETDRRLAMNMAAPYIFYAEAYDSRIKNARKAITQYQLILSRQTFKDPTIIEQEIDRLQRFIDTGLFEINQLFERGISLWPANFIFRQAYHGFLTENGTEDAARLNVEQALHLDKDNSFFSNIEKQHLTPAETRSQP